MDGWGLGGPFRPILLDFDLSGPADQGPHQAEIGEIALQLDQGGTISSLCCPDSVKHALEIIVHEQRLGKPVIAELLEAVRRFSELPGA
jgi:hypothetical protein